MIGRKMIAAEPRLERHILIIVLNIEFFAQISAQGGLAVIGQPRPRAAGGRVPDLAEIIIDVEQAERGRSSGRPSFGWPGSR